ncbi:fused D-ribose transporter subunits of ABC superfamily: ATP-binding components [uncultured Pleomorphomonas sp.]|uniref:D-xylose ABC transporter ATP-binding protein n=2 Tax=Pleomorphomonas TaxID=261933 RepID=A0A2G9X0Y4_9HYPH|nr:sugar ABC transporter ATP-binding protein [Pleomorphomonas carboxyditropha]PIP00574.1 D-xylose ABC transporter ATP-binding protein [Pleomorphomonas carboxyditropha]SCM72130.1 fused D-ribose transporter subunits of ABC superfamily: ATP-binding components [uncultured Pleomorphomonas sp.]
MSDLVRMTGIDKHFPGVHALRNARFELQPGEVHALMGENGAGKSTLMKVLAGIYQPDAGKIEVAGEEVTVAGPRAAQALGIGIIHQELSLMKDLTVAQNIMIGREPRKSFGRLDEGELNRRAAAALASIHMNVDPRTPVSELTIARQQMIEIAKALSNRSRILIMDEPTAALTDSEIAELFAIIRVLKSEGVGIVYISHKMDELKRIADRVTVMRDGEFVGTVGAAETPVSTIISMMVGRALTDEAVRVPDLAHAPTALEVRNLSRGRVIKNVSFTLRRGEILGFAGLMGAGRTEVARAIFGADPRDGGEIIVDGQPRNIRSPREAVQAGIGYLSEDRKNFGLALGMDVRANIGMATLKRYSDGFGRIDEKGLAAAARKYVASLTIRTPSDRQEVRLLSGGNQQKVVVAKWLLRDCDVLIFDEPTRGIDVGAKAEIYRLLASLAEQGKALIVISSELPEILRVSHRIAVMCEGRLTGILPGGAATSQEDIMHLATQRDTISKEHAA